jgi:hypothetical protein
VLGALRAAAPRGPTIDLQLLVGPEQVAWSTAVREVLDEGERLAGTGELLPAPGPPSIVAVRQWAAGQVVDQARGSEPRPWRGVLSLPAACASGGERSLDRAQAGVAEEHVADLHGRDELVPAVVLPHERGGGGVGADVDERVGCAGQPQLHLQDQAERATRSPVDDGAGRGRGHAGTVVPFGTVVADDP